MNEKKSDVQKITEALEAAGYEIYKIEADCKATNAMGDYTANGYYNIKVKIRQSDAS